MAHVLNVTLHAAVHAIFLFVNCTVFSILEIVFCNTAHNFEGIMSLVIVGFSVTNVLYLSVSILSICELLFDHQRDSIKWIFKEKMSHSQFLLILLTTWGST